MKEKTCDNCTFLYKSRRQETYYCASHLVSEEKPTELCEKHKFNCGIKYCLNDALYIYNDEVYCVDWLMRGVGVETVNMPSYFRDDEFLGTGVNYDKIIENLNKDIKTI